MKCFAHFCNYKDGHDEKRSLFRFPKDSAVRKEWLSFCEVDLNFQIKPSDRLCSIHFDKNCVKHLNSVAYRDKNAIPTLRTYDDGPFISETIDESDKVVNDEDWRSPELENIAKQR